MGESSNQCQDATVGSQFVIMISFEKSRNHTETMDDTIAERGETNELRAELPTTKGVQLHRATMRGDWKAAKTIIDKQKDIVSETITSGSEIALHVAVARKHKGFVKNLLLEMKSNTKDLAKKNKDHNTALHIAAALGVVEIAKMLIKEEKDLPNIPGGAGTVPIYSAALFGQGEMVRYLYKKTNVEGLSDKKFIDLFHAIISADIYDVALDMLENKKKGNDKVLSIYQDGNKETALHLMARKPSHKNQLNLFQEFAYFISMKVFYRGKKMQNTLAHKLVEELWDPLVHLPLEDLTKLLVSPSKLLFDAAESGNVEFLVILIGSCPDIIWITDNSSRSLFHIAVLHRHERIFKFICELGGIKNLIASHVDNLTKDNLLHLVARLPPPNRLQIVSGAALQMQRELLWFKAVKEIVPRSYIKARNKKGEVAHDIFRKEHDNLRKQGEKWMKETATACMLVATLIATVVFAAAFTVPGSYDDSTGYDTETDHYNLAGFPRFRKKFWFDVFLLSNSVSLLSSVTAVGIFLSILTSRYAEKDFRRALPKKLMLGLFALFISVISMVLAFTATMILIRHKEPKWSLILIICLASLTTLSFICLHFRLWFDTLCSSYFDKYFLFYGRSNISSSKTFGPKSSELFSQSFLSCVFDFHNV